jgi:ferredoxin-type protein NapH
MADPFAVLQILLTRAMPEVEVLIGAAIILLLYGLIAGRSFCAWVCPLNLVTDLAGWLRRRLSIRDLLYLPRSTRYMVLLAALLLSAITAVAAFEWISPIGMLHRELVYGIGLGWIAVLGIFIFDLFVIRHGWCGHLCPLGAFYALLGKRSARLVVGFDAASCTHCAECATVCPEPQVLNLKATPGLPVRVPDLPQKSFRKGGPNDPCKINRNLICNRDPDGLRHWRRPRQRQRFRYRAQQNQRLQHPGSRGVRI